MSPFYVLLCFFFFNDTATTEIYTLSLHDALPIYDDVTSGLRQVRTFASFGRYIYELIGFDGRKHQVCAFLSLRGDTLMVANIGEDITPIIRREYKRMRRRDTDAL